MRVLRRWLLIASLLLPAALERCLATSAEKAFVAASNSLKDEFFLRAEKEFGEFVRVYTNSPRLPEAILFQAEARLSLQNYDGAFELLSAHQNQAGKLADE